VSITGATDVHRSHLRIGPGPHVLIIADEEEAREQLERILPASVAARCVATASETEALGTVVVVIGGSFPLAEFVEVRAHPQLFDKPVVLFAPGKILPDVIGRSSNVYAVTGSQGATAELVGHVDRLLPPLAPTTG
jgi:hypothetical protein